MNIVHIATRMKHHSPHSGYDRLSDYIPCEKYNSGWVSKCMGIIPDSIWGLLLKRSKLYLVPELKREADLQLRTLFHPESIFHFLYGENDFRKFRPQGKNKIFVTYHFPPEKFRKYFVKPPYLGRVNALIVVGLNQVEYFSKWISKEKILFIPHGIDTKYFSPVQQKRKDTSILFVGTHMRNFDFTREVIEKVEKLLPEMSFTIITPRENWEYFQNLKSIKLNSDISEDQLLKCYQDQTLLFLPLSGGTANNTLLEAAACGLPIITNDVGAVKDYLDEESAVILPSLDLDKTISAIIDLSRDEKKRSEFSVKARAKALSFDWEVVAQTIRGVYEEY